MYTYKYLHVYAYTYMHIYINIYKHICVYIFLFLFPPFFCLFSLVSFFLFSCWVLSQVILDMSCNMWERDVTQCMALDKDPLSSFLRRTRFASAAALPSLPHASTRLSPCWPHGTHTHKHAIWMQICLRVCFMACARVCACTLYACGAQKSTCECRAMYGLCAMCVLCALFCHGA